MSGKDILQVFPSRMLVLQYFSVDLHRDLHLVSKINY